MEYVIEPFPEDRLKINNFYRLYKLFSYMSPMREGNSTEYKKASKLLSDQLTEYDNNIELFTYEMNIVEHGWRSIVILDNKVLLRGERFLSQHLASAYCCQWAVQHMDYKCLQEARLDNNHKKDAYIYRAQKVYIFFTGKENDVKSAASSFIELSDTIYKDGTQKAKDAGKQGAEIKVFRNNYIITSGIQISKRIIDADIEASIREAPLGEKMSTARDIIEDRDYRKKISYKALHYNKKIGKASRSNGKFCKSGHRGGGSAGNSMHMPTSRSLPAPV